MATTQWAAVTKALVSAMRAVDGYWDPHLAGTGRPVFLGPELELFKSSALEFVVFGYSGANDSYGPAGVIGQEPGPISSVVRPKDERGEIMCVASAGSGSNDVSALLDAATEMIADVETAIRSDPTLGLGTALTHVRLLTGAPTLYRDPKTGPIVDWEFTISYFSRI